MPKQMATASLKFSLEPWKVQKENERKLKCQQSWTSHFPLRLKTKGRGKPWISVPTITGGLGLFSINNSYKCSSLWIDHRARWGWEVEKPYLVHTSHFWHGMSPKMPQGLTGTMFNMQQEHGELNQAAKWDVAHKKCVWCVHEYTAVAALTWISIRVS